MTQENRLDFSSRHPVYKLCVIKCLYRVHIHKKEKETGRSIIYYFGVALKGALHLSMTAARNLL